MHSRLSGVCKYPADFVEPIMNNAIAVALLCSNGEPITCEEDVNRLYRARIAKTGNAVLLEMARAQLVADIGSMCGNIGKVVQTKKRTEPMPAAKPVAKPAAKPVARPAKQAKHELEVSSKATCSNDFLDEIRRIFADEFEEKDGSFLSFGEIYNVFVRSKGVITEQENRLFRFYSKTVFLEQWPNTRSIVHQKKRCYINVSVKDR
jgi:hypothetical protein